MRIKVLWIDDEYKKQSDVIGDAEQDGIDIFPFESHEEGIAALTADIKGFHAVILDAKVKKGKEDTVTNLKGLAASRDRLIELNNQGEFLPFFIFTGQPDYMSNEDFRDSYGDFFIKGKDNQRLFDIIKEVVQNKDKYIIEKSYQRVFGINGEYFDSETKNILFQILHSLKHPENNFNDELYFTQLRIIIEKVFRQANKIGLLHDLCLQGGKVNLTESSLFLAGIPTKHLDVSCSISHFPKIIADSVRNILFVTGAASHTTEPDLKNNIDIQHYRTVIKSPYLLYSLTFQLLDILIWFDEYQKKNSDYDTNVGYWELINFTNGTVIRIAENGYGTFLSDDDNRTYSIIPEMVKNSKLHEGQKIKVRLKKDGLKTKITDINTN